MSDGVVSVKYCTTCGRQLHVRAEICPGCGVRAMPAPGVGVRKVSLLLLTLFLGSLGAHKYYQKQYAVGVFYFLFSWTLIPGLISLIEFIIYCTKSEEELRQLYPETSDVALILGTVLPLKAIPVIGILAAIAIPQFAAYRQKAHDKAAMANLQSCRSEAEAFYTANRSYPIRSDQLDCTAEEDVAVYYLSLGTNDYQIVSFHRQGEKAFLTGNAGTGISENPRTDIEKELAEKFGLTGGYGRFYFIE